MSAYVKSIINGEGLGSGAKLAYSASVGFVPWNFAMWPMQIFFAVIAVIVLAELGLSARQTVLGTYLAQALLTTAAVYWMLSSVGRLYSL